MRGVAVISEPENEQLKNVRVSLFLDIKCEYHEPCVFFMQFSGSLFFIRNPRILYKLTLLPRYHHSFYISGAPRRRRAEHHG